MGGQTPGTAAHVLFLNWRDVRNPQGGGSEVYVESMAGHLVAAGHQVTLLTARYPGAKAEEITEAGVRIVRRGGRHSVYLRAALAYLAGRVGLGPLSRRRGRPDVIVDVCNGLPFLSASYARRPVVALVHHVHREQWPVVLPKPLARIGWWLESTVGPRVYRRSRYVTVSEATKAELAGLGVDPARITVIHNGTPEAPAAALAVRRCATPAVVVLGRLVPHKRVEIALQAVARLADELPELECVVAGQGWWEPQLRRLAEELEIDKRVHFTGFVSEEDKHGLLGWAWVALTPSLKEGWGLTIVEAGARGTPTVAFRSAGGVTEAVLDGTTGLLAEDVDDFTAKLHRLLADHVGRQEMGEAARAHAARFTWAAAGAKFAAVVNDPRPRPTP